MLCIAKNTFFEIEEDISPLQGDRQRRHKTCALDELQFEGCSETETEERTRSPDSDSRGRLSSADAASEESFGSEDDLGASCFGQTRSSRSAYMTEDLREDFFASALADSPEAPARKARQRERIPAMAGHINSNSSGSAVSQHLQALHGTAGCIMSTLPVAPLANQPQNQCYSTRLGEYGWPFHACESRDYFTASTVEAAMPPPPSYEPTIPGLDSTDKATTDELGLDVLLQCQAAAEAKASGGANLPAATLQSGLSAGPEKATELISTAPKAVATAHEEPRRQRRAARLWVHIYLHMQVAGFDLVPMTIGRGGCNMRKIAEKTGAKLRIRGQGSGHLEIDGRREAPVPLMLAVTVDRGDRAGFKEAVKMALEELETVAYRFKDHCKGKDHHCSAPFYSIGLLPDGAEEILGDVIRDVARAD